jgi:FkbM family methyltransferase
MSSMKKILKSVVPPSLWQAIRRHYIGGVGKKFVAYTVTKDFHTFPITFTITDPLSESWYGQGNEVIHEIKFLEASKLKTGATIFDIGAHQGIIAIVMAKLVGVSGKVLAVEANPYHAKCAESNKLQNDVPQLTVINKAVAAEPGELSFSADWDGQSLDSGGVRVTAEPIDALAKQYGIPDVLFIDVEGFECEALKGATEVLKHRPDFYIEVHVGIGLEGAGGSVEKLLALIPKDYTLTAMQDKVGVPEPFHLGIPWLNERFFLFGTMPKN